MQINNAAKSFLKWLHNLIILIQIVAGAGFAQDPTIAMWV
jgi:hypothetical protein